MPSTMTPSGPNLLVDASLYVGEELRAELGINYPALIEEIAVAAGVPVGRLAVRPLHVDRKLGPWAWRITGPALQVASG